MTRASESNVEVVADLIDQAVTANCSVIAISGDTFANGRPTPSGIRQLQRALAPALGSGTPIVIIDGNHELLSIPSGTTTINEVLGSTVDGLTVVSRKPQFVEVGGVQIIAMPWMTRQSANIDGTLSPSDADDAITRHVLAEADRLANAHWVDGHPHLLMGHFTASRPKGDGVEKLGRGSEADLTALFSEPVVDGAALSEVVGSGYGALGHIHNPHHVAGNVRYAGAPNPFTHADTHQCGGYLVNYGANGEVSGVKRVTSALQRVMRTVDATQGWHDGLLDGIPEGAHLRIRLAPGEMKLSDSAASAVADLHPAQVKTEYLPAMATPRVSGVSLAGDTTPKQALSEWCKKAELGKVSEEELVEAYDVLSEGLKK